MLMQSILTMLISLIIGSISARYLGPENYGTLNYGASIVALFSPICTLGLQTIIVNEIVKKPECEGEIICTACFMRIITTIFAIFAINIVVRFLEPENELLRNMTFLQTINLIMLTYEVFTYWFQAKLQAKYIMFAMVASSIMVGIWKIILLMNRASAVWFALSTTIQSAVILMILIFFFLKLFEGKLKVSWERGKELLGRSYHLILFSIGVIIYGQIDRIMIGRMLGDTAVGYYSAAYTIATIWYFIPNALVNSYRPHIYEADNEIGYDKRTKELSFIIIIIGLLAGVGFTIAGKLILLILYGSQYMPAMSSLLVMGWVGLFAQLAASQSVWLIGKDYQKYMTIFALFGALVNVIFNFILIPIVGIVGASLGTLLAQILVQLIGPLLFKKTRRCVFLTLQSYKSAPELYKKCKAFVSR
jgi:PST family polysaccharide transporter